MNKFFLLLIASFCAISTAQAQAHMYNFTQTTATYADLTDDVVLSEEMNWDGEYWNLAIGFSFKIGNRTFTTLSISDDGYVGFADDDYYIDAFYTDFVPRSDSDATVSPISYKKEGSPGNRILKIQWKNVGFYGEYLNSFTTDYFANVQLWLYEKEGKVEVHVGPHLIADEDIAYEGEGGPSIGIRYDIDTGESVIYLEGNPASPELDYFGESLLTGTPAANTVYTFTLTSAQAGIKSGLSQALINVYPNPTSDLVTINIGNMPVSGTTLRLFNTAGQTVWEQPVQTRRIQFNLSQWPAGVYMLQISSAEGTSVQRLVKR